MRISPHARTALSAAVLVAAIGISLPLTRSTAQQSITPTASRLASRIPEVGFLGLRRTDGEWSKGDNLAVSDPTPAPTPVPTPTPPPPPPTPTPPPFGGLKQLDAPVVFTDHSQPGYPIGIQAGSGILVDMDTRQILWQRNMHQSRPPASTTKIVSSLVALDNFSPDKVVTITPDALTQASDETTMGIHAGESYKVDELLAGMLTVSANDAATAMAVDTVGLDNFVGAMNAQMQALGLHDSHFVTPVGLDDPQQYSSAYDLAAVALTDVANFPTFRNIVFRSQVNLPQTATHPAFELDNLNRLLQFYPYAVGIKPGWTGNAGPCLVGMGQRGTHHLIVVVMNDPVLYSDGTELLKWGFSLYGFSPDS